MSSYVEMTERYIFVCTRIYILDNGICDNTSDKFSLREAWCSGNLASDTKIFNFAKGSGKKNSCLNGRAIKKGGLELELAGSCFFGVFFSHIFQLMMILFFLIGPGSSLRGVKRAYTLSHFLRIFLLMYIYFVCIYIYFFINFN